MALTRVKSAGVTNNAIGSSQLDLTANYAFTGTISGASGWRQETKSADNSATNLAFDIASGAEIIFVTLENLYKSGTNTNMMLQIGNASSFLTSGYQERNSYISQSAVNGGGNYGSSGNRNGWVMSGEAAQGSTYRLNGTYRMFRRDFASGNAASDNVWICDWTSQSQTNSYVTIGGGSKNANALLTRVRIISADATGLLQAGSVTVRYLVT